MKYEDLKIVAEYLIQRSCDPWDDELWPAANDVLNIIAAEITHPENEKYMRQFFEYDNA